MNRNNYMMGHNVNRQINPKDIQLKKGYKIEVFSENLTTPIDLLFASNGRTFVADSGITDGNGKVLELRNNRWEIIADGFHAPLTGINEHDGKIYVSHRTYVSVIEEDGTITNIIEGLPSLGDHHNNRVVFGADHKMYFGQGTATNSGVVGKDNDWVPDFPFFHDYPGSQIKLTGQNFKESVFLENFPHRYVETGAYSPFGVRSYPGKIVDGIVRSNGSILRANLDGSELELVCWGLRNPFRIQFDSQGRLFAANHGYDVRGSRPIANAPDEFIHIKPGTWYGFPDYSAGEPVTMNKFKAEGMKQPKFLLENHPMKPPKPFTTFAPHSATMGFSFNESHRFGPIGSAYIAEFGSNAPITTGGKPLPKVGHRVSTVNMTSGAIETFAINKDKLPASMTNSGGFERPIDAVFNVEGELFIVDFGVFFEGKATPNTGVIWKIKREY